VVRVKLLCFQLRMQICATHSVRVCVCLLGSTSDPGMLVAEEGSNGDKVATLQLQELSPAGPGLYGHLHLRP